MNPIALLRLRVLLAMVVCLVVLSSAWGQAQDDEEMKLIAERNGKKLLDGKTERVQFATALANLQFQAGKHAVPWVAKASVFCAEKLNGKLSDEEKTDWRYRFLSCVELLPGEQLDSKLVPALTGIFASPIAGQHQASCDALAKMGPRAKAALPSLEKLKASTENDEVAIRALRAIKAIKGEGK